MSTSYDQAHAATARAPDIEPPAGTLIQMRSMQAHAAHAQSSDVLQFIRGVPVQRRGGGGDTAAVHEAAARGVEGGGGRLPHLDAIQCAFGPNDVSGVQAHVGGQAAEASAAMGAQAYATGNDVAFAQSPDLHTAAHEAAHVVQQRGGVSLKGGVGQVGDPYERHADAVADRVVQGRSAVDLLDQMTGGGGGAAVQREETGEPDGVGEESGTLGMSLDVLLESIESIENNYEREARQRMQGVNLAKEVAKEKPSEKLDAILLKAAAEIALSGGAAAIGRKIVGKLIKDESLKALQDGVNKAIQETIKKTVGGAVGSFLVEGDSPDAILAAFFDGQWKTVEATQGRAEQAFTQDVKPTLMAASDGLPKAEKLYQAQNAVLDQGADETQKQETLIQWINYMAQTELGTRDDGQTDLGDALGDTSVKGVLGLRFEAPRSGFQIVDAEMDGVGERLASRIAATPIKLMKIPLTVKGAVVSHGPDGARVGNVVFGRNEGNTVWDKSDYIGQRWLHWWAHPQAELWGAGGPSYEHVREARFDGVRALLAQEIDTQTLKQLGVEVQTSGGVFD